jgi:hypothetical protein
MGIANKHAGSTEKCFFTVPHIYDYFRMFLNISEHFRTERIFVSESMGNPGKGYHCIEFPSETTKKPK